jgi:hypothetical protein
VSFPSDIRTVVGVDQTGAVGPGGRPRPLFAARLRFGRRRVELSSNLRLAGLTEAELEKIVPETAEGARTLVVVDSALGLPRALGVPISRLLSEASRFRFRGREYGAETASRFFRRYLEDDAAASYPRREAEVLADANSVFQRYPFQKNIAAGTFRVLKDLGRAPRWFRLWPFEAVGGATIVVAEGYPSLLWRQLLRSRHRKLATLHAFLERELPGTELPKTPDDADAAVLALGGFACLRSGYFHRFTADAVPKREGWIVGLERSGEAR